MLERIIENWLDKASERSFQKPFCHMLSKSGYTIIHLSRHCGMELGKDIIAIDPEGTVCAYQLKGAPNGKISLRQWRDEINAQVIDLVSLAVVHPSLRTSNHHKSYFVTNGELEEEVSRAIDDLNRGWERAGHDKWSLQTVIRGQILEMAKNLEAELWPSEVTDFKNIIELYFSDGHGPLPKAKLADIFESIFSLDDSRAITRAEFSRRISSAALLCSLCISNFTNSNNYLAEIEGWVMYAGYVFALREKGKLPFSLIQNEFDIAEKIVFNAIENLVLELQERQHVVEGSPLHDQSVLQIRVNWLLALVSVYAIWQKANDRYDKDIQQFIGTFCRKYKSKIYLWGEAAIPQLLAFYWYYRQLDTTPYADFAIVNSLINSICQLNEPRGSRFLANPYYQAEEIVPYHLGTATKPLEDSFSGQAYLLEGLVHLFVRRNWKNAMKLAWPGVSRLSVSLFMPKCKYHFYRWNNRQGILRQKQVQPTQQWDELKNEAHEEQGKCIPNTIRRFPVFLLLFVCVYPHRLNAEIMRWLDSEVQKIYHG